MKTLIYIKEVKMSSVHSNAGVFYGENSLSSWHSRTKGNNAVGRVNGDGNRIASRLNAVHDQDIVDMAVNTSGQRTT
ncbi:MAG: hypothetical protein ACPLTR_05675 [Thermacetogeniaceae bacterium]